MKFTLGLVLIGLGSGFLWGFILADALNMTGLQAAGATMGTCFIAAGIAVSIQND